MASRGVCRPLSPARKMTEELMRHALFVPALPLSKACDLGPVMEARRRADPKPSWSALFIKAYALTARRHPGLRQAYIPYPVPHLYEHPFTNCAILVEREYAGETAVYGAKVRAPEAATLIEIDGHLRRFQTAPVEEVGAFRQILRVGRMPRLVRRFLFWQGLYFSGNRRAKHLGTCMVSSVGNLGVEQVFPQTPLTTYLTFGPIDERGHVTVRISFDHRVLDARGVARCLCDLEQILRTEIVEELRSLERSAA